MNIDKTVDRLIKNYNTSNPFALAVFLDITAVIEPLGAIKGYYNSMFGCKIIHISDRLCYLEQKFICAHEIGHAIFQPHFSYLYSDSFKNPSDRQANIFAIDLLIYDATLAYPGYDISELCRLSGIPNVILDNYMECIK